MMSGGDGQPETLGGVTVTLSGEHAMGESAETDMNGGFAFTGLRAGTYTVTISGFPEDVSFETVSMDVEVEVGDVGNADFTGHFIRTSAVAGQVIIEGEGLQGVTVTLAGGPADESYTSMTDAEGMYSFAELRPGSYTISISDFDSRDYEFASTSQDVSVDLDETGTVSFTGVLLRTSGIAGRVSVEGMGLGDITVTLSGADDRTAMTDASGQYAFAGLAAGDYMVSIMVESNAYVFSESETSKSVTVGDDESKIVNFEGAHDTSASVSGMLYVDEAMKNDMHDEGEDGFPSAAVLQALQAAGVQLPPVLPVPITLHGPGVNQMQSGSLNLATGQFSFGMLRAGSYELRVGSLASVLSALPAEAAAVLRDFEYGGPAAGYPLTVGVGEAVTQNVPVDITHTTAHFVVTLKAGDNRGMPVPGASVTLASGESTVGSGMTGDTGLAMIRFARAGTSGNMVSASVKIDGYHVADGMTTVAWDPKSPHTQAMNANDIVNLNVDITFGGATITTEYGGGDALKGWALSVMMGEGDDAEAVEGDHVPEMLDDMGMASFKTMVDADDLPAMYTFDVAADQDDKMDGGENYEGSAIEYTHDGLSLMGAMDAGMIEVAYTTQTLKVYVHNERDQVEGYTGNLLGGDERDDKGRAEVIIEYIDGSGRSRAFQNSDSIKPAKDNGAKGVWTFSNVPADANVIVMADKADDDDNIMILNEGAHSDELAAYRNMEMNGVTGGAFGEMGGFGHTVELCPLKATNPQDHGECASFAYVTTHNVSGLVWKRDVIRSGDDFLERGDGEGPAGPRFEAGLTVSVDPVEGKNLAGEGKTYTTAEKDTRTSKQKAAGVANPTHQFDFDAIAAGAYKLSVPTGWRAKQGEMGSETDLDNALNPLGGNPLDGDVTLDVTPATATVFGIVKGSDKFGLDSVTVDVNGRTAMTDNLGRYIVDGVSAIRGKVFIKASRAGSQDSKTDSTSVEFKANTTRRHDFELSAVGQTASVSGTVRASGTNAPVAGVEIKVDDGPPSNAATKGANKGKLVTGADGTYTVTFKAKDVGMTAKISAHKDGMVFVPGSLDAPAHAGSAISGIDFTGFVNATISGRVVAPGGGPLDGVVITATPAGAAANAKPTDADTTTTAGTFLLSVPFGSYTLNASKGNHTFDIPAAYRTVNVAPGQSVNIGSITAATAGALNVKASRMRQESDDDASNGDETQRWATTISVTYTADPKNIPEGFGEVTYTIQTNTGTEGAWTDATGNPVTQDDESVPGSFTIPTPDASAGGDGEFMVRVVTAATETTASAPFADTSSTATVTAVDPSASGVSARRQAATDSDKADASGNFIRASWSAVTNTNSDFRVVAQVTAASLGGNTVWVVLAEADANDRAAVSEEISTINSLAVALPSGVTTQAVSVTEKELAAAIRIAVESVQGTADATEKGPKWKRSTETSLALGQHPAANHPPTPSVWLTHHQPGRWVAGQRTPRPVRRAGGDSQRRSVVGDRTMSNPADC